MNNHDKDTSTTDLIVLPQSPASILEPYTTLSRRQFLMRSSLLAAASSALILPKTLRATDLILPNALPNANSTRLAILNNSIGFNGERRDPVTNLYHLGQGYRAYNPALMRFHAADNLSPFGAGGINAYAYNLGDPINRIDPTGHISWEAIFGIALGVVGLIISVATLGAGIYAGAGLITAGVSLWSISALKVGLLVGSAVTGIASAATGIASIALAETNPEVSQSLATASLVLGVVSLLSGGIGAAISKFVTTAPRVANSSLNAGAIRNGLRRTNSMQMGELDGVFTVYPRPTGTVSASPVRSNLYRTNTPPYRINPSTGEVVY